MFYPNGINNALKMKAGNSVGYDFATLVLTMLSYQMISLLHL